MKNLFTLTLCFLTLSLTAQETGCTYPQADNYSSTATVDDGSCVFGSGLCGEGTMWNEDTQTCIINVSYCSWQPDSNADGLVGISDLLDFLSVYGDADSDGDGVYDTIDDCIDLSACNYQVNPTESCLYNDALGFCGGECASDLNEDGICDLTPITNDNIHEAVDLWLASIPQAVATYGHISEWDVSSVTNMSQLFYEASSFNGDLSSWDVSHVTSMNYMFGYATSFNGDISSWDVSSVTDMTRLFRAAASFNGDISSWDVSSVTVMIYMFFQAPALSEENKCLIHTSFYLNTNWPYDWSGYCPFVCGDLVSHQGYGYSTVLIGDQCWFSENCRYLPSVTPADFSSDTTPYYYVYSYDGYDVEAAKSTENYETFGVLYNWPAVMTEGICPSSWHIPSDGEWQTMEISLGMSEADAANTGWRGTDEGYQMKSASGWNNDGNGSNLSGFNGFPGGTKAPDFVDIGDYGYWWSSSESGSDSWTRALRGIQDGVYRYQGYRFNGFSARCIKD